LFASCCVSITSNSTQFQPSTQQSFYYFNSTTCFDPIGSSSGVYNCNSIIKMIHKLKTVNTWRWPNRVETHSGIKVIKRLLHRRLKLCTITKELQVEGKNGESKIRESQHHHAVHFVRLSILLSQHKRRTFHGIEVRYFWRSLFSTISRWYSTGFMLVIFL
jgi:hypothetical protein